MGRNILRIPDSKDPETMPMLKTSKMVQFNTRMLYGRPLLRVAIKTAFKGVFSHDCIENVEGYNDWECMFLSLCSTSQYESTSRGILFFHIWGCMI